MTLIFGADLSDPSSAGEPMAAAVPTGGTGRIVRGGLWYFSGQFVNLLVALVATPFVIRLLGTEKYGLLALINLVVASLAFTDLGMGTASTRFGAAAHARGDDEGEAAAIRGSLVLGLLPAALAATLLILSARPLLGGVLRVPPRLLPEAVIALQVTALALVARVAASVLNTPLQTRLRMGLYSGVTAAGGTAQILLTPVALALGGGLIGVAAVITGVAFATASVFALLARRTLPHPDRPRIDRRLLGRLTAFGSSVAAANACLVLLANGERIFLARLFSVEALAYYTVALSLANLLLVPATSLFQSMLPAFARFQGAGQWKELRRSYDDLIRGALLLMPPAALLLCLSARPFFTVWAGAAFGAASTPLFFIMMVGLLASVLVNVPSCLLVALDRAHFGARYHAWELVPYLLLALLLTARWGGAGAAAAWSLRLLVALPVFSLAARRSLGLRPAARPPLGGSYLAALAVLVLPSVATALLGFSWPLLLLAGVMSTALYLWLVFVRLLQETERAWVRRLLLASPGGC